MLVGDVLRWRFAAGDAGIVDEDVDLAVTPDHVVGDFLAPLGSCHIHDDDFRIVAFRLEGCPAVLRDCRVAIGDDDFGAGFGKGLGAGEADGAATARDEGGAAGKLEHVQVHGSSLVFSHGRIRGATTGTPARLNSSSCRHRH